MHNPQDFMYEEFLEHKKIFNMRNKWDYMMLSSGTNQFPLPRLWKETIAVEIDTDFTYQLYVSPFGFDTVNKSLKMYENFISTGGKLTDSSVRNNNVCMTIGASQAAFLAIEYLFTNKPSSEIYIIGYNYPLYASLSQKRGFSITQIIGKENFIPNLSELLEYINNCPSNSVFIFSHPNNPSGEQYTQEEYNKIVLFFKRKNIFAIFDLACNLVISNNDQVFIEASINTNNYWSNSVIINSFSKTDSAAGFRIGYIYGESKIIDYFFHQQATMLMALPSFPVLAIFFTSLFRCIYLNSKYSWNNSNLISTFKNIFYITTSIPNKSICDYIERVFSNVDFFYEKYVEELLCNENTIMQNLQYVRYKLKEDILNISRFKSGFNLMIKHKNLKNLSEIDFVSRILKDTGLAIITESAFSLEKTKKSDFWFRISLAYPESVFIKSIDKLSVFLQS